MRKLLLSVAVAIGGLLSVNAHAQSTLSAQIELTNSFTQMISAAAVSLAPLEQGTVPAYDGNDDIWYLPSYLNLGQVTSVQQVDDDPSHLAATLDGSFTFTRTVRSVTARNLSVDGSSVYADLFDKDNTLFASHIALWSTDAVVGGLDDPQGFQLLSLRLTQNGISIIGTALNMSPAINSAMAGAYVGSLTMVPEAATFWMLGLGLGGIAIARRRTGQRVVVTA